MGLRLTKLMIFFFLLMVAAYSYGQQGFTQKDRELLIEMRTRMSEMDKRFEQVDKRFDQVDIRFSELREDMNKRFEQVDKRFEEMITFIGILAAIFGAMTLGLISLVVWDRSTMIRPFESKVAKLDDKITTNSNNHKNLIASLKEYASKNKSFACIIQRFNLF